MAKAIVVNASGRMLAGRRFSRMRSNVDKNDSRRVRRIVVSDREDCAGNSAKPRHTAEQLHELARDRLISVLETGVAPETPMFVKLRLGLPYAHPPDALGRNWNIAEVQGLGARQVAPARLVIDGLREAFDLQGD